MEKSRIEEEILEIAPSERKVIKEEEFQLDIDYSKYGFKDEDAVYEFVSEPGLSPEKIILISKLKNEPEWMTEIRLKAYEIFLKKPIPNWGVKLDDINFDEIVYYVRPTSKIAKSWDEVPEYIRRTYEKLGIPEAERKYLGGVEAQYDSEVVYSNIRKDLEEKGVIFLSMDEALKKYPEIVKEYFGTVVPASDNKFAALNTAVWSGGSFVYVPKGVKVDIPLQAYFRINYERFGQFERTLIIAEEGAYVHYIEGCLPAGEMVSLGDKWTNIEAIKPGDFVITHKGVLSKVRAVMTRNYKGYMYKITPISPFNSFSLTEEHPVLAIKREWVVVKRKPRKENWLVEVDSKKLKETKPLFIPVKDLKPGDFIIFPKIKNQLLNFNLQLTDEEIEFLGFYTAEGSAYYHKTLNQYVVSITFSEKEVDNIKRVKYLIEKITGKKPSLVRDKNKHAVNITVYSKQLYDLCVNYCGKFADQKALHPDLMQLPPEKLEKFFQAYFKGDGNICIKNGKSKLYRVSTASLNLAIQLQEILARMGIYASISKRKGGKDKILGREINRKDQYIIAFTYPKKWSEVRETEDYYIVPIKKIEKFEYEGPVFNIDVEGDNSYLVKGFAVHNCTAPIYDTHTLHAAVVEVIVKEGAHVRYTTIQNWSRNVLNLVTKRAKVYKNGFMEWISGELGSGRNMKYPSAILVGENARADILSMSFANTRMWHDTGGKVIIMAPNCKATITSKSISKGGGISTYRGLVQVHKNGENAKISVSCDALIMDDYSTSNTYPYIEIEADRVNIAHEAKVGKIGEEQIFYLMSRGLSEKEATTMIVMGFIEPLSKELPMEYAIELNRLIELEMEGSVG